MHKGFTMIELILVVALLAILSYMAVPMSLNFYRSQTVEGVRDDVLSILHRARHNALLMKGDSRWGLYIDTDSADLENLVLYKGADYDAPGRNEDSDEIYVQAHNVSIEFSGSSALATDRDINFAKLTGFTNATGTITLTFGGSGEQRAISIDQFGNAYATSTDN